MPRPVPETSTQRPVVAWRLELLGRAQLLHEGQTLEPLERRAALMFAYLALEGPTSRAKLAGLIWAESTDEAARANLRQRLKRLKNALGAELIVPEETLRLRPDLEVDVVELESPSQVNTPKPCSLKVNCWRTSSLMTAQNLPSG
jgi:DNA-binding SARP family transcriptional activator